LVSDRKHSLSDDRTDTETTSHKIKRLSFATKIFIDHELSHLSFLSLLLGLAPGSSWSRITLQQVQKAWEIVVQDEKI